MPSKPCISLIVAMAANRVIGRDGDLPWRLSADLRRFKQLTTGHPIVMGRRTWESLGRALPGRTSIVVSRQADFDPGVDGVLAARGLADALELAQTVPGGDKEVFVIGGGELYRAALPAAQRLYLTRVLADVAGDVAFPEYDAQQWQLTASESHEADAKNDHPFRFEVYERVAS